MSGPVIQSSWAKVAAKSTSNVSQQAPASQQTSTSAPASTTSGDKDEAASNKAASEKAPSSLSNGSEANEQQTKVETSESSSNTGSSDLAKALAASTFSDEAPTAVPAIATRDDTSSVAGSLATSAEKNKSSSSSARGHDDSNSRRPRKTKRSRNAEKEEQAQAEKSKAPEVEAPRFIELHDSQPPAVNVWQKRIEAQAAKKLPTATKVAAADSPAQVNGAPKSGATRVVNGVTGSAPETSNVANGSASGSGKPQKSSVETPRAAGEQQAKRNAPRGSRVAEKDEKAAATGAVPSVGDATSWPTPDTAATVEDKKAKAAPAKEQVDDESNPPKAAQKTTWQSLPFTPSTVFETSLSNIKGPKPRGGGRGGRDTGGRGGHSAATGAQSSEKAAGGTGTGTGATKTSESRERKDATGTSAQGSNTAKRVPGDATNGRDQRKPAPLPNGEQSRDPALPTQATDSKKGDAAARGSRNDYVNGESSRNGVGRKSPEHSSHAGAANRERAEGRGGGRGGAFRRGGAHAGPSPQGHVTQPQYQFPNSRYTMNQPFTSQAGVPTYSSPPQQFGFGAPPNTRHGRGNNVRSQSLSGPPHNQGPRNNTRLGSLQPQVPAFYESQYNPAEPAQQYYDPQTAKEGPAEIMGGVQAQMEYYFSEKNLAGDFWLRNRMDSQGFVPLTFVADFSRLRKLTPSYDWLITAGSNSDKLDLITIMRDNNTPIDLIRARGHWESYIMPWELRETMGRSHGPDLSRVHWRNPPFGFYPAPMPMQPMYHTASPTTMGGFPPMPNGTDEIYSPFTNGVRVDTMTNGNGTHGAGHHGESQLSANVAEFSPSGMFNKTITLEEFQKISDAQVEQLTVQLPAPTSDAVVNGTHGSEAEATNDKTASEAISYPEFRSRALDKRQQDSTPGVTPPITRQLYFWWSEFLPKDFNSSMYENFRNVVIEDAKLETPRLHGIKQLIAFYKKVIEDKANLQYPNVFLQHREEAERLLNAAKLVVNGTPQN